MKHRKQKRPKMGQAGRKFRPHPGPLPQEREERLARSNRAAPTARLLRGTFLVPHPACGGRRCSEGRERKQKQSDGLWAGAATPSPGGEGRGEGGIPPLDRRAWPQMELARALPTLVAGPLRRTGTLPREINPGSNSVSSAATFLLG